MSRRLPPDEVKVAVALRRVEAVEEAVSQMPEGQRRHLMASLVRDLREVLSGENTPPGHEFTDLVNRLAAGWAN